MIELYQGNALDIMKTLHKPFDAIITDPSYASGGSTLSEKQKSTAKKNGYHSTPPLS